MHDRLRRAHDGKGGHRRVGEERLSGNDSARCKPNEREATDPVQRMQHLALDGEELAEHSAQGGKGQHAGAHETRERLSRLTGETRVEARVSPRASLRQGAAVCGSSHWTRQVSVNSLATTASLTRRARPSKAPSSIVSSRPAGSTQAAHKSRVGDDIDRNECRGKLPLDVPGESGRVEHADEVVGEKSASVARLPAEVTEMILERGEWADAVRDLHPASPGEGRQVQKRDRPPAPGEKTAEDDERREGEMEGDEAISEQRPDHQRAGPAGVCRGLEGLGVACASGGDHMRREYPCDAIESLLERLQAAGE